MASSERVTRETKLCLATAKSAKAMLGDAGRSSAIAWVSMDHCVICQNEGAHDIIDRPHVMEGQE